MLGVVVKDNGIGRTEWGTGVAINGEGIATARSQTASKAATALEWTWSTVLGPIPMRKAVSSEENHVECGVQGDKHDHANYCEGLWVTLVSWTHSSLEQMLVRPSPATREHAPQTP